MTVNPVDLQIILPQSGQVNKITRGLQFQQQIEQQVLTQQVQENLRRQEHQVKKTGNIEGSKVENEKKGQSQGDQYEMNQDNRLISEKEENAEKEIANAKSNLGNVLDIKA